MILKIADKLSNHFISKGYAKQEEKEIYVYGLDIVIATIITWVMVIGIAVLAGHPMHAVIYLACTAPLRMYGGGWHARTHVQCTMMQCASFLTALAGSFLVPLRAHALFMIISYIFCVIIIVVKAPSEHPDNPLHKDARRKAKWKCLVAQILLIIISISLYMSENGAAALLIVFGSIISCASFLAQNKTEKQDD